MIVSLVMERWLRELFKQPLGRPVPMGTCKALIRRGLVRPVIHKEAEPGAILVPPVTNADPVILTEKGWRFCEMLEKFNREQLEKWRAEQRAKRRGETDEQRRARRKLLGLNPDPP